MMEPVGLDLREVAQADVYIGEVLAAHLTRERGDAVSFDYAAEEPGEGRVRDRSVSWSLLRSGEYPVRTEGGAVPPFFAGLLPEGVRLGVVTSSTKTSADDHLTLLLAIGADTIGDIRVLPAGAAPLLPLPLFEPKRDNDFHAVFAKLTGSVEADPVGLAGVQPKVSAGMMSTPAPTRAGPAILKLNPAGFPHLVETSTSSCGWHRHADCEPLTQRCYTMRRGAAPYWLIDLTALEQNGFRKKIRAKSPACIRRRSTASRRRPR